MWLSFEYLFIFPDKLLWFLYYDFFIFIFGYILSKFCEFFTHMAFWILEYSMDTNAKYHLHKQLTKEQRNPVTFGWLVDYRWNN